MLTLHPAKVQGLLIVFVLVVDQYNEEMGVANFILFLYNMPNFSIFINKIKVFIYKPYGTFRYYF
jgi:hypothetical protein